MPRPGRAPGAVALFLAIELLDELVFGVRDAAWPLVRAELGLTYAQVGLLLAVPSVVSAVAEPLLGLLADVWRRRALIAGGGLAFAGALALAAASGSFLPLLASFALLYPASGAFVSIAQASVMDAEPDRRERNMVRWTIAGSLGGLAGPAAVAAFAFLGAGWRPLFAALAVAAALLAVASLRVPHRRPPLAVAHGGRGLLAALRRRAVLRWLVLLEASDLLLDVFLAYQVLYLVDEAGLPRPVAALAVSAWVAAGLGGNLLALRLLPRLGGAGYLRMSAVAAAALFAGFLVAPPWPKLGLLVCLGTATAGWYPVLKGRLYGELPGLSGTAISLGSLFGLAGAAAPLAVGLLADHAGLAAALWLLLLAPAALLVLVPKRV